MSVLHYVLHLCEQKRLIMKYSELNIIQKINVKANLTRYRNNLALPIGGFNAMLFALHDDVQIFFDHPYYFTI